MGCQNDRTNFICIYVNLPAYKWIYVVLAMTYICNNSILLIFSFHYTLDIQLQYSQPDINQSSSKLESIALVIKTNNFRQYICSYPFA